MPHVHDYKNAKGGFRFDGWTDESWKKTFNHYKDQTLCAPMPGAPATITYSGFVSDHKDGGAWIEQVAWTWHANLHDLGYQALIVPVYDMPYEDVASAVLAYIVHFDLPGDIEWIAAHVKQRFFEAQGWRVKSKRAVATDVRDGA